MESLGGLFTEGPVLDFSIKLLGGVVALIVGLWIAGRIGRAIRKMMKAREMDPSLAGFLSSLLASP